WTKFVPQCDIILMGDDDGVAETAQELNVKHVPSIEKNEYGTPLLSSAFDSAKELAKNNILMYANADVIFFQDLIEAVQKIDKPSFLLCGRRWDLDITEEIDFTNNGWASEVLEQVKNEGKLHGLSGMDYFVFPRNLVDMPAFAVGRPGWDAWLIYHMRSRRIPVIDATEAITVIHQNHDFSHSKFGKKRVWVGLNGKKILK
ncbi:glycosyl transferase family 2, partial [bacterium]|nr:glycosyl transferase family 2 [bacterium]